MTPGRWIARVFAPCHSMPSAQVDMFQELEVPVDDNPNLSYPGISGAVAAISALNQKGTNFAYIFGRLIGNEQSFSETSPFMKNVHEILEHSKNVESFVGLIIPVEWDEDGNITAVAIATEDEKEYRISYANRKGKAIRKLLRKRVRIKGKLEASPKLRHQAVLLVESFKLL